MSDARPVVLRPARIDDAPAIVGIWHVGWGDGHLGFVPEALVAVRSEASFHQRAIERIDDTVVAEVDGVVAGFHMVEGDEVEQIYVDAAHRGRGVADVLLDDAERRIAAAGHHRAWLAVVAGNTRARRFYERRGWHDGGAFAYAPNDDVGVDVPAQRYEKEL